MKKALFLFSAILMLASCREEPEKSINLGDYNTPKMDELHSTATTTPDSAKVDSAVADSSAVAPQTANGKSKEEIEK